MNTPDLTNAEIIDFKDIGNIDCFTYNDITNAINTQKAGKSAGKDALRAEAFKHANHSLNVYLCMFLMPFYAMVIFHVA